MIIRNNSTKKTIDIEIFYCKEHIRICEQNIKRHKREISKLQTEKSNMKSRRQQCIDIIMAGDEDNEQEMEFLQSLTLNELEDLAVKEEEVIEEL